MPLMISEIGIRMAVGEPMAEPAKDQASDGQIAQSALDPHELDALVQRCVQDVLLTLRMQEGR